MLLSGIPGLFSLSISIGAWVPKIWRGVVLVYWFRRRDAARAGSGRLLRAPALTSFVTLTRAREGQAVVRPLLRGSSPTRSVAPKPLRGLGRASLRHFGLVLFIHIHWRVGAEDLARRKRKTRRLLTNRPCSSLVYEESDSKERLRVSNWIVQRLYKYAVKKTVEL